MRCFDTCIIIDFLRGRTPELYDLLEHTDPSRFIVPAVVAGELYVGAAKSSNPVHALEAVEEFLLPFEIVPFDNRCAYEYGRIRADLEQRGLRIGSNDMLIAATARAMNATLVTNNVREFKRIPGFSLETWDVMDVPPED